MTDLVRVELLVLRTTPALYVTLVLVAVLCLAGAAANILLAGQTGVPPLGTAANAGKVLAIGSVTSVTMLILGILISAGEDRHRTIIGTYLAEPHRGRVLLAKLLTGGLVGAALGAVFFAFTLAVAVPLYAAHGVHHLPVDVAALALGTVLITCCYGLLGVAMGSLTRNTVAAVVGSLVWVGVVELAILQPLIPSIAKWLPTGAGVALTSVDPDKASLLPPAAAAAVLIGWAALIALIATRLTLGRQPADDHPSLRRERRPVMTNPTRSTTTHRPPSVSAAPAVASAPHTRPRTGRSHVDSAGGEGSQPDPRRSPPHHPTPAKEPDMTSYDYDTTTRAVHVPTWSRATVLKVWAAAAIRMAALAWVIAPVLAHTFSGPTALPRALILSLGAGLIWQFALVLIVVRREQGTLSWPVLKAALWLHGPISPRTGKRSNKLWWTVIPLMLLLAAGGLLPALPTPSARDTGAIFGSDAGQSWMSGNWIWFAILVVQFVFDTALGEELFFRGLLLPRMGAFGRGDWVANGLLFACDHLHEPWVIPQTFLVDTFAEALPSRRWRSALIGIVVHSGQTVFCIVIALVLVLR